MLKKMRKYWICIWNLSSMSSLKYVTFNIITIRPLCFFCLVCQSWILTWLVFHPISTLPIDECDYDNWKWSRNGSDFVCTHHSRHPTQKSPFTICLREYNRSLLNSLELRWIGSGWCAMPDHSRNATGDVSPCFQFMSSRLGILNKYCIIIKFNYNAVWGSIEIRKNRSHERRINYN